MNAFGNNFRVAVFGESHGPGVGVLIDGVPPGILLSEAQMNPLLKAGYTGSILQAVLYA
jgi:chorismate synthase